MSSSIHTKTILHVLFIAGLMSVTGCSDEPASSNNESSDENPEQMMQGSEETSSFEVESKDSSTGMSEKVANEVPNAMASKENGGASIAGSILNIYLVAPNGTTISAVVETSEMHRAPGSFEVGQPPEGSFVTWLAPINGQILNSRSGRIVLDGCPEATGDKVVGRLDNVELVDEISGTTQTLTGKFDVSLYSVAGALLCNASPVTPGPDMSTTNPPMCEAELCSDNDGSCCPYVQCISACEFRCVTQDPACSNPLTADPVKCVQCFDACLDECNVSNECRTDYTSLSSCQQQAGCENEDEQMSCTRQNCCTELDTAF